MWLNRVLRLAAVAVFGIGFGQVLSSHAQAQDLYRLPSPYGGSLTVDEQKASAAVRPALADANWNHEVCAISYNYENTPRDIAKARVDVEKKLEAFFQQALINDMPKAQIEEKVKEATRVFEAQIKAAEKAAAPHLANIPKCKGQFFRPALESVCGKDYGGNRFCAQLDGSLLPGVELLEDKLEFAHGLSWNKVGELFTRGASFAPAPWGAAPARALEPSAYPMTMSADGAYIFKPADGPGLRFHPQMFSDDSDLTLFDQMAKAREADLEAASKAGIAYIATVNNAMIGDSGEEMPFGTGQWAFSIGVDRFAKYEVGHEVSVLAGNIEREIGMVTDLGEYYQLPSLHFQALIYDVLVQSDFARFAVEKAGGETVALKGYGDGSGDNDGIAWFQSAPDDGPFFGSSYASYRVHALMTPSPDDLKAILDPQAAFLVASFEMLLEDGSIDVVTLRTPLTGISAAWTRMNRDHLETRNLIRQKVREWDGRTAEAKAERAALVQDRVMAWQAMAVAAEKEARAYIAANPFARGCERLPIGSVGGDADSVNRRAGRIMECDKRWVARMRVVKDKLGSLRSRYS
ncbi:MAG TPA: hypothetical protein VGA34_03670, partial [Alteraurantiacibacter sp.]